MIKNDKTNINAASQHAATVGYRITGVTLYNSKSEVVINYVLIEENRQTTDHHTWSDVRQVNLD